METRLYIVDLRILEMVSFSTNLTVEDVVVHQPSASSPAGAAEIDVRVPHISRVSLPLSPDVRVMMDEAIIIIVSVDVQDFLWRVHVM